eukprot:jgi/Orpsp1_1/1184637/evm.model.c7180000090342.1
MTFKKVVIVGGGVLGSQIAFQSAYCGFDITILLRSDASIERAKPKIERRFFQKTDLTNEEIDELKAKVEKAYKDLKYTTSFEEACKDADLIIESIAEDPKQKTEMYEKLAQYMEEKTVIVTNSSTLLPSQFADATGRPEKYLAFHFANYIWKMNTAEIMVHSRTDKKYFEEMVEFAEQINMIPLKVNKEQPGYILNSMLIPFFNSGLALWVNDVADPETIDKTWKLATGAPKGPFEISDFIGLVTLYNIQLILPEYQNPDSIVRKIADKLKVMIDAGKTGINAGEGFYKYN